MNSNDNLTPFEHIIGLVALSWSHLENDIDTYLWQFKAVTNYRDRHILMSFKQRLKFWRKLSKEHYPQELQTIVETLIPRIQRFRDKRDWLIHGIPTKNSTSQRIQFYRNRHLYHTPESIDAKLTKSNSIEKPDLINRLEDIWFSADEFLKLPSEGKTLNDDFQHFQRKHHFPFVGNTGSGYAWLINPGEKVQHLTAIIDGSNLSHEKNDSTKTNED